MASAPQLRQHLVVFLDVLGFSEAIYAAYRGGDPQQQYERFRAAALDALKGLSSLAGRWDVRLFTDNILLAIPTNDDRAVGELAEMYDAVSRYQLELALAGYFVRGGVELGDYACEPDMIYGRAIIDAVKLEKAAKAPRVLLGDAARRMAGWNRDVSAHRIGSDALESSEDQPRFRPVRREGDAFYIDYLIAAYDAEGEPDRTIFQKHRDIVSQRLDEHADNAKVRPKYKWLQMYHNRHCTEAGLPSEFLIAASDPDLRSAT